VSGHAAESTGTQPEPFRADLEGLRGLAILLVLLFHAGIPGLGGGFVGVDVFFVLSGFLITGALVRERERTGRIDLAAFYARRARRILPASLVVILGTLLVATVFLTPLDLLRAAEDAVAVALSAGNLRFAAGATDYFAASNAPSPFLQYWSLGVEEQFYLLWPALLLIAMRFGPPRRGAVLALSAVAAGSLLLTIWLTGVAPDWAFYSLPTRAWQLGIGGLLAVGLDRANGRSVPMTAAAGWLGLATVVGAAVAIDASMPYPGFLALLPSVGACALIAAGTGRLSPGRLLTLTPVRILGRISFSVYLVHWPILVLPATALSVDEALPLEARLGLAGLSVLVGALCWRTVERPLHRSPALRARPMRALGLASGAIAATVAAVLLVGAATSRTLDDALASAASLPGPSSAPGPSLAVVAIAEDPGATGHVPQSSSGEDAIAPERASNDPTTTAGPIPASTPLSTSSPVTLPASAVPASPAPSSAPDPRPTGFVPAGSALATPGPTPPTSTAPVVPAAIAGPDPAAPSGAARPLPTGVRPSLRSAAGDRERLADDGCELGNLAVEPAECSYGNPDAAVTLALVGDSHAAQWFPTLESIALRNGWRLVTFTKISCRFVDLPVYSRELKREYTECAQWRESVVDLLQAMHPDLTVVSAARGMATLTPADDSPIRQGVAMARLLNRIPGAKAIMVDTPQSHVDVPACLSGHIADTRPCDTLRSVALGWRYLLLEETAGQASGAVVINMTDSICTQDVCPAIVNDQIVLRDVFHLTATFAASLADLLEPQLIRALGT